MTRKQKFTIAAILGLVALVFYIFCLPEILFHDPYSTVLEDQRGELLSASIAGDGQWRFPQNDSVPDKFAEALIAFEDKRFHDHFGVDLRAMARAIRQNSKAGKVVSGGSTLTMQVIRLSRKGKPRSVYQKFIEMILATRLEFRYPKEKILALYASHAPFGGNVVGLDAACWRYFGRDSKELSWGEAALLAVLPNSPSLIHLSKNREQLKAKRDRLLDKLHASGKLDNVACALAKDEPIPDAPIALPKNARHLLFRAAKEGHGEQRVRSTIDAAIQIRTEQIINDHHQSLKGNQVFNAAAIVIDVRTGKTLAYVGNTEPEGSLFHSNDVDIINSPRSTGSILKPFLFAAMLDEGKILQHTLLPDVPTVINGFSPKNFTKQYDGAVAADQALIRSLNVPAVHMLRQYRYEKFHSLLKDIGMTSLSAPPDHYGLSLILGGAEGTLWDIASMYASLARTLNNFSERNRSTPYSKSDFHPAYYIERDSGRSENSTATDGNSYISASSIYLTFDALKEVYRPGEETGWRYFSSTKKIAWKTGTSFGLRDGWAVGVTPQFVVGVWVGNADGEGRPGLTGTETAAPIMFDIFSQLPGRAWFHRPQSEMEYVSVCKQSGQRNTSLCSETDTTWITKKGLESVPCSFHKRVHLSADKKFRVNSDCEQISRMTETSWFVLPPIQEFYYRSKILSYKPLPPYRKGCQNASSVAAMDLIYPKAGAKIYIPRELDGTQSTVIFELAHRSPGISVFWHVDGNFVGTTQKRHHLALKPTKGKHILTLVDEFGESMQREFEVISEM